MNTDIATACATRPEERARQIENQILNDFEAALKDLRAEYRPRPDEDLTPGLAKARHSARRRKMQFAITRVRLRCNTAGVR